MESLARMVRKKQEIFCAKYAWVFLIFVLIITGCRNPLGPELYWLDKEFTIRYGEKVVVPAAGIILRFTDVLEDSRCPKSVDCFWAGNAKISLQVNHREINLNTLLEPRQAVLPGYNVRLLALTPYPDVPGPIPEREYIVRLVITAQ